MGKKQELTTSQVLGSNLARQAMESITTNFNGDHKSEYEANMMAFQMFASKLTSMGVPNDLLLEITKETIKEYEVLLAKMNQGTSH